MVALPQTNRTPSQQTKPETSRRRSGPISNDSSKTGDCPSKVKPTDDAQRDLDIEELENEIKRLKNNEKQLEEEFQGLKKRTNEVKRKLEQREEDRVHWRRVTKRLTVSQKFLSTADSLSQGEVVQAMEALNEEIFQLTSIMGDNIQMEEKIAPQEKQIKIFGNRLAPFLKRDFVMELIAPKQLEDTLALQIGWQAILVRWCSDVIRRWALGDNEEVNEEIVRIYKGIAAQNGQAVAGRWRTIAHGAMHNASPVDSALLVDFVIKGLVALPVLCGYVRSKEEDAELSKAFQPRIGSLLEKCLNFRKMVGEGFTSVDVEPYLCESGKQYNPLFADLEYESKESAENQGVIACTVCLGLLGTRRSKDEKGVVVEKQEPMLKPKVVLQKTLVEIIS